MLTEDQIHAFSPEELGILILGHLKKIPDCDTDSFHLAVIMKSFTGSNVGNFHQARISDETAKAIFEAWNWLNVQGLLVMNDTNDGNVGYRVLSRRAMKLSTSELKLFSLGLNLKQDQLHPSIAFKVWGHFTRSDFDAAVMFAGKAIEVKVREKSGLEGHGRSLIHAAFKPGEGPLSDPSSKPAENESRMLLFSGFIGTFKNPQSHRFVNLDDPLEAMQIVLFASRLLSILDDLPDTSE